MNKKILLIPIAIGIVAWIIIKITDAGKGPVHGTDATMEVLNSNPTNVEKPKAVTVILDNSGSMQGYLNFASNGEGFADARQTMITNVQDFMGNVDSRCGLTSTAVCGTETYESVNKLIGSMRNYSAFRGATTELDKLVGKAVAIAGDTAVSVMVTDMVMSKGKAAILASRDNHLNEHEIDQLAGDIGNQFKHLRNKGIGALILKYNSDFNGNYYYNCTENIENGTEFKNTLMKKRPYYFLVIGKDEYIKSLCLTGCFPKPDEVFSTVRIDDSDLVKQPFAIATTASSQGWIIGDVNHPDANGKKVCIWTNANFGNAQSEFNVAFDAIKLPLYATGKVKADWDEDEISSVSINPGLDGLSFTLKPFNSLKSDDDVDIEIELEYNIGNVSCSVEKDYELDAADFEGKTWGFRNIIKEIYKAYDIEDGDSEDIAKLSFGISLK